jgi:V-type H+-transporting ATPase subunit d
MKIHLASTDYGDFLANEPSPLHTTTIADKCTEKLVREFNHIRAQAAQPLATFLDYITYVYYYYYYYCYFFFISLFWLIFGLERFRYQYMIDNVVLLITGTLHERELADLLEKCHPLGFFEEMGTLSAATNVADLYQSVLIDTPLGINFVGIIYLLINLLIYVFICLFIFFLFFRQIGPYIQDCLSEKDFDEMNIGMSFDFCFMFFF